MLEKIENSIADAQMVLVGIGAEMEADMDGKDASFYDSLKEQAERDLSLIHISEPTRPY